MWGHVIVIEAAGALHGSVVTAVVIVVLVVLVVAASALEGVLGFC